MLNLIVILQVTNYLSMNTCEHFVKCKCKKRKKKIQRLSTRFFNIVVCYGNFVVSVMNLINTKKYLNIQRSYPFHCIYYSFRIDFPKRPLQSNRVDL